jgi:hypothetical protein
MQYILRLEISLIRPTGALNAPPEYMRGENSSYSPILENLDDGEYRNASIDGWKCRCTRGNSISAENRRKGVDRG